VKEAETMSEPRVTHERLGHILKITIDNPAKKNAFIPEMMQQLSEALTLLDAEPDLWVGVLCAAGEHFTAGLDMPKFFGPGATAKPLPEGHVDPFGLVSQGRKPLVTAVQGICFTIGIEIALAGDIIVAADDSRFCQMEAKRGIAPLGGAHFRYISRAGWGNAMLHLLTCDEFGAAEAHRIGLVQEVVPAGTQIERAMAIAEQIAANAPLGIQATKQAGRQFIAAAEAAAIAAIGDFRGRVMASADAAEGIRSFIERRPAVFRGE
jgi:enoyl-CoA hydratase/carnithine racemase